MEENINQSTENKSSTDESRKIFNRYLVFFLIIFLIVFSYYSGLKRGEKKSEIKSVPFISADIKNQEPNKDIGVDFSLYWKVWDILKEKYVDKESLDAQTLIYGSIEGMLSATGDLYSNFFDPQQTAEFSQQMEGSFEGIGAELGIKNKFLTVIAPLKDSPAEKAGLRAGDKIIKIDDKISADLSIDEAVSFIRGERGTDVRLTVLSEGEDETREINITRAKIIIKSVELSFLKDNIAHLEISEFIEDTSREFSLAENEILSKKSPGIILDLRNNPGGYLKKAVDIASRIIPKGKVVVIEEDNTGKKESIQAYGGDNLSGIPMVILINEGSASAAEILAGALRDNQGTTIVGKESFGKASVQEMISLPEKSSVKITVAKWLTPNGEYIMNEGIKPDIEVELTREDYENDRDPQLDKALEIIKEKIQ